MITINVLLEIKDNELKNYLTLMNNLVEQSSKEVGCCFYAHFENVSEKNKFAIIENWENQEAIDLHNQTPHFKQFFKEIGNYLSVDLDIKISFEK